MLTIVAGLIMAVGVGGGAYYFGHSLGYMIGLLSQGGGNG